VGSRRLDAAEAFAAQVGVQRAYKGYDALLADDDINAIYVALPNSMHAEWTIAALEAGKHVLCEKPMAMNMAEAQAVIDAAERTGHVLVEGFMYRFHPRIAKLLQLLHEGVIGQVRLLRATYTFDLASNTDVPKGEVEEDIRLNASLGGGALNDLGSYCVNGVRAYGNSRVTAVQSWRDPRTDRRVETACAGQLQFDSGAIGQFYAALDMPGGGFVEIVGTAGRIRVANAFRIRSWQGPVRLDIDTGDRITTEYFPFINQYELEIAHCAAQVLDGAPEVVSREESLQNAATLEAIRVSWRCGATVTVPRRSQNRVAIPATMSVKG
jgi:predicted dehydrogenase